MEHLPNCEPMNRHEHKGKGPERHIDAMTALIDACLADTEVVYVVEEEV